MADVERTTAAFGIRVQMYVSGEGLSKRSPLSVTEITICFTALCITSPNFWAVGEMIEELEGWPCPSDLIQATQMKRQTDRQRVVWTDNSKYIGSECPPNKWKWVPLFLTKWSFYEKDKCSSDLWNNWGGAPTQTTQRPSSMECCTSPTDPGNHSHPIPRPPFPQDKERSPLSQ